MVGDINFANNWIKIPEKDEKYIPPGPYCYHFISGPDKKRGALKTLPCPYWDNNLDQKYQLNGYCHFIEKGDWEDDGTLILFDLCKECGRRDSYFYENYHDYEDENSEENKRYENDINEWAKTVIPLIIDEEMKEDTKKWLDKRLENIK